VICADRRGLTSLTTVKMRWPDAYGIVSRLPFID